MSYEQQIEQLMAEYTQRRQELANSRKNLAKLSGTATAPRRSVQATVGAQGELAELVFPTTAYRRMAPKELADAIVAVITEARAKAMQAVVATLGADTFGGEQVAKWMDGAWEPDPGPEDPMERSPGIRDFLAEFEPHPEVTEFLANTEPGQHS